MSIWDLATPEEAARLGACAECGEVCLQDECGFCAGCAASGCPDGDADHFNGDACPSCGARDGE